MDFILLVLLLFISGVGLRNVGVYIGVVLKDFREMALII
jgi:hypothetical protein